VNAFIVTTSMGPKWRVSYTLFMPSYWNEEQIWFYIQWRLLDSGIMLGA
jgi:hypothetical protein